ncbi:MAG: hydrogenase maturation nickel metallochaperone HypA [Lachnospiraceae bacterium]|nr:hydrogenase maturation nickel metallochaperone HypA [Lachnospiraceae bacterium]
MHEMSYVVRFVNMAIEAAKENKAVKVKRLLVSVGEMTDVLPEYLNRYYSLAVMGTILEGSVLETKAEPVRVLCTSCGKEYHPEKENGYACPVCQGNAGKVVAGRDVVLEHVELETGG